jgi:hypothetical protein
MVASSLLLFLRGPSRTAVLIAIAGLLVCLGLLAFLALYAGLTTDLSPTDHRLIGPFRWLEDEMFG